MGRGVMALGSAQFLTGSYKLDFDKCFVPCRS